MDVLPIHRGGGEPFNNSPGRHAAASSSSTTSIKEPDPEKQLKTGIALIQDAFDKKTALLAGELSQWKQTASSLRQEVYSLEKDNKSLQKKVMELEKMCLNQANEIKALTASKSGLHERYLQLKQNAMQLESFRKNIASMVEYGPSVNVLETDQSFVESTDIQEALKKSTNLGRSYQGESGSHPNISERDAPTFMERNPSESQNRNAHDITARSFELSAQSLDHSLGITADRSFLLKGLPYSPHRRAEIRDEGAMRASDLRGGDDGFSASWQRNHAAAEAEFQQTKHLSEGSLKDDQGLRPRAHKVPNPEGPHTVTFKPSPVQINTPSKFAARENANNYNGSASTSTPQPQYYTPSQQTPANPVVDAPTLYKQIRDTLSSLEFEEFAANVAAFNASEQSADETVNNIGSLVKDRLLFAQMRTLIYTALAESAKSASVGAPK